MRCKSRRSCPLLPLFRAVRGRGPLSAALSLGFQQVLQVRHIGFKLSLDRADDERLAHLEEDTQLFAEEVTLEPFCELPRQFLG